MGNVRDPQSGCGIPLIVFALTDSLLLCMVIPRSFAGLAVLRTLLGAAEACVTVCRVSEKKIDLELTGTCFFSPVSCCYLHDSTKEKSSLSSEFRLNIFWYILTSFLDRVGLFYCCNVSFLDHCYLSLRSSYSYRVSDPA
jgi:hypothetical protein